MPPKSPDGKYTHFPLFMDLREKRILFAGGGRIASRRLGVMRAFEGSYTVIASEISDAIRAIAAENPAVMLIERDCTTADLDGADIVIIATDDRDLNAQLAQEAHARGLLVNDASHPQLCDFYFPGIVTKDETVVGVTASGRDHYKAKKLRIDIAEMMGGEALDVKPRE